MGIVVTVVMLLGLIVLRPTPWRATSVQQKPNFNRVTMVALFMVGAWNVFWYGLRYAGEFWGWAAVISGSVMICAALLIFFGKDQHQSNSKIKAGIVALLALSFLLYSVTIVQLNLGLPILGS